MILANIFKQKVKNNFMKKIKKIEIIVLGTIIGIINGFFGGGGGMIVVPLLTNKFGFTQKQAQATAIFVILPISIASSFIYITKNSIDFTIGWIVILGVVIGGICGALLLKELNNLIVKAIFTILMLIGGLFLLFG